MKSIEGNEEEEEGAGVEPERKGQTTPRRGNQGEGKRGKRHRGRRKRGQPRERKQREEEGEMTRGGTANDEKRKGETTRGGEGTCICYLHISYIGYCPITRYIHSVSCPPPKF